MPTGPNYYRLIDSLVAEHLMGCDRGYWSNSQQKMIDIGWFDEYTVPDPASGRSERMRPIDYVPNYSTDIAEAWKVAVKFRITVHPTHDGWEAVFATYSSSGEKMVVGTTNGIPWMRAKNAALAICKAALSSRYIAFPKEP